MGMATAVLLGGVYAASRGSGGSSSPASAAPVASSPAAASADGYADAGACATCHRDIARTYALTGMARSLTRVKPAADALPEVTMSAAVYHEASDRHYTVSQRDGALVQRRHQQGPGGAEVNVLERPADYVIGSGNHARTFVHQAADGRLLQLPLSWYADGGGRWAMSPGYDRPAHLDFRRVIDEGCMSCHNAYPRAPVADEGTGPKFGAALPEGIDCQRCHGPGQAHIDAVRAGDLTAARAAVVNPARLDRARQLEVCYQCHLEPTSMPLPFQVRKVGRPAFSYRPGTPLADTFLFFDHAPSPGSDAHADKFEIAGAAYRLAQSACFQASEMTCVTCHNPHDVPRGAAAARHYTRVCQGCHTTVHPGGPPTLAGAGPRDTCVDCHMPRRRTDDAVHVVMTDHRIQRRRPARDLTAPLDEAVTLAASHYQGEVALYYPASPPESPDTELYLALAQVQQASNLAAGIPRLQRAIETLAPAQPEFYYELARAHAKAGRPAEVVRWSEAALARDAGFAPALKELAGAAMELGQVDRAAEALERAVRLRPGDSHALADLGNAHLQRRDLTAAVAALDRALALDAHLPAAHNTRGLAAMAQGDVAGAERHFLEAVRLQPDLADAHANLGNVLASRQRYADAVRHFDQARRADPSLAAAHHGAGLMLALTDRPGEAVAALREAARLAPSRERIQTDLADVLRSLGRTDEAAAAYREALRRDARDFEAHMGLGELLVQTGRPREGAEHLRRAAESPDPGLRQAALEVLSRRE